ncbi:hypothetical protein AUK40_05995 [Candidatus Wirthbacteria bacterium CG2_30_54_11]|uniref:ATP-grasp domain-containing protein n=1 Tax=Candidatus Wirthbacteria bacterium CG2_30_54_11 TaxID=1817892 RepID=A0A1J5IQR6_9BACT|nr:MAG: hypothetical protein AUK40_05995 [Candidatus Wirthbacteria bacterium CG2_30_54_11]
MDTAAGSKSDNGTTNDRKKFDKVIYVFNMAEDVWAFINSMSNAKERYDEIEICANLGDRELLSTSDESDLVFISPKPIDPAFVEYFATLFGKRKLEILVPRLHSGEICKDILRDDEVFNRIVELANSVKKLTLLSYTTSHQFLDLVARIRDRGVTVYTPESPEEDCAWTVNFFGSKSGIRQLAQKSCAEEPDLIMADGLICSDISDAAKIAANKYIKENGVVLKTNKGHTGMGVLIFRPGDLPATYNECREAIYRILNQNEYWDKFSIIIESLLSVNHAVGGGFPSIEFKIRKSGEIELLYFCGMRVSREGVFQGIELNEDVINDRIEAMVTDMGFYIGEQLASAGYRGYFDVDMVAAKNGKMYVTESNIRRTGGSHVYKSALKLIGKDFMIQSYIFSDNTYELPGQMRPDFVTLHRALAPVLFSRKTKEGVVIASANMLQHGILAYIVFGASKKHALEIEARMKAIIAEL